MQLCRQSKPKSNTEVFDLGFSFAKIKVLSAFFGCRRAVVSVFSGFVWCVRIPLSVAVAGGFMPRKVLDVRKECVRLSKCDVVVTSTIISYADEKA